MPDSYFIYNGKGCIDWGCRKTQPINFPTPVRDVKRISVIGRNGDFVIDNGRFENVELVLECYIKGKFLPQFNALRAFMMADSQYHKLVDSLYPNEYRMARVVNVEPKKTSRISGTVEITFDAKPQRYLTIGKPSTHPGADTMMPTYALSGFDTSTQGALLSAGEMVGYSDTEINNMRYRLFDLTGVSAGDMMQLKYGADDAFFGMTNSGNPTTNGGATRLLDTPKWRALASELYLVVPDFYNIRLYRDSTLIREDASYKTDIVYNPTQFDAKPLVKITTDNTQYSGYVGGINDCGIILDTRQAVSRNTVITIDTETMDAYSLPEDNIFGQLVNLNPYVGYTQNAMTLIPGENEVLTNAHIVSMTVEPRWWTL